ncbi:hypothetical protein [Nitratireductor pacificus]|uniref:Uncharacterized protein n=1 Tax=Nitratireductor pacificus pht-3B TaxID=391937 RepID=K2LH01_9HYPH|nr:hypothetical protein [Nitratireductor pacificus]EKF17054.1 hypothetical protein NA2_19828 [Nitratireductor pacificus pht-3B]
MLRLSRVEHARKRALDLIDQHFAARIDTVLGPLAALHLLKRIVPDGHLVPDRDAVVRRAAEQDAELAAIDHARRVLKADVRAAATSDEIRALTEHL